MGFRDWFRKTPLEPLWRPESDSGDSWSPVRRQGKGQQSGPIRGTRGNRDCPVNPEHQNRAGHRLFVKLNQDRQTRINLVGFGRWRRPAARIAAREYGSHAENTSQPPMLPRWLRRIEHAHNYRQARRNRLRAR